jgi:hypothetical protein
MFDSMSENVKHILLEKSRAIAFSMKHEKIHPEHIMMALFEVPECVAVKYLKKRFEIVKLGPEIAAAVMAIPTGNPKSIESVAFSEESKKVIDQMLAEAKQLGCELMGTEHLLMALVLIHGPIRKILKEKFDVTYGQIREALKPDPAAAKEAGGLPAGAVDPKTVRVSPIMGAVFFDAKLTSKDIDVALFAIEQIKGVAFTQPMAVPSDMAEGSEILKGRFKDPKAPR